MGAEDRNTAKHDVIDIIENPDGSVSYVEAPPQGSTLAPNAGPPKTDGELRESPDVAGQSAARAEGGDEDEPGDEASLAAEAAAVSDEEREAIRERRRVERRERKERQRAREDNFRLELAARDQLIDDMRSRLDAIDRRGSQSELAQLEARIRQEAGQVDYLKTVIVDATKVGNGEAVAEATTAMIRAMRNQEELTNVYRAHKRKTSQPAQPQLDPRMVTLAAQWMEGNSWYNPAGRDADSRQVLAIDQRLADRGLDPTTPAYWEELDREVRTSLPHRAGRTGQTPSRHNDGASQGRPSGSPVAGGSGGAVRNSGGRSFTVSAARVQALKDAGMWDDPVLRANAIKRFRDFDAEAAKKQ